MSRKSAAASTPSPSLFPELDKLPPAPAFNAPLLVLDLAFIHESPTNPRKHVEDAKFGDLVASVRTKGVLTPVLVRPVGGGDYELVYGHRRFRAAKAAGLPGIPANVRELNDQEVLEIQLIENAQRSDIHPLEEADGFRRLHKDHGLEVEEIAKRTGKSKAFVYARMKLCSLKDETAREAFLAGDLSAETALLIARIDEKDQGKAAKLVLTHDMSTREAQRELLESDFLLLVDDAPFDASDASLVPAAGPCTKCPKRVDPQGLVVIGQKVSQTDICSDDVCWDLKVSKFRTTKLAGYAEKGYRVLSAAENAKILRRGEISTYSYGDAKSFALPAEALGYGSRLTWKEVLAKAEKAGIKVAPVAALDGKGKMHTLVDVKAATAAAKKCGALKAATAAAKKCGALKVKKPSQPTSSSSSRYSAPKPKKESPEETLRKTSEINASSLVRANFLMKAEDDPKGDTKLLALLVAIVADDLSHELGDVLKRLKVKTSGHRLDREAVHKLKIDPLRELAVESVLAYGDLMGDWNPQRLVELDVPEKDQVHADVVASAKLLGVDVEAIRKKAAGDYQAALHALKNPAPKPVVQAPAKPPKKKSPFKKIADATRKRISKKAPAKATKKPAKKKAVKK